MYQDDWVEHVELIQAAINVTISATTNHSPFEILYGFNPKHGLDLLIASNSVTDDWAAQGEMCRKDAADAISIAQQEMIRYGDAKRKAISFAVGDKVFLRLASPSSKGGYVLLSTIKPKIAQQRAGPFKITRVVQITSYLEDLACHLSSILGSGSKG